MSKGTKYRAIVFAHDNRVQPRKYEDWINDESIDKNQFQRFIKKSFPDAAYANLYNKETKAFYKRISI